MSEQTRETALERYERLADEFFRDTGMMAPGKDVPAEMGGGDRRERIDAFNRWSAARNQATEVDAARYRFLRDNPFQLRAIDGNATWCGQMTAEQFDAHTDIARTAAPSPRPASAGETETLLDIPGATPFTVEDWQELLRDAAEELDAEAPDGGTFVSAKDLRAFAAHLPVLLSAATRLAEAQREGEALVAGIEGVMRDLQSGTYAVPCADEAANHLVGVAEAAYHTLAALSHPHQEPR